MHAVQEIDFKQARIDSLASQADNHLQNMRDSWQSFVSTAMELKALLGLSTKEWDSYTKERWQIAASTIRLYKSMAELAIVVETATDTPLDKQEARKLKQALTSVIPSQDSSLSGEVWALAYRNTDSLIPSKQAIQCAYEVVKEVSVTGAFTYEGESVKASDVLMNDMFQASLIEKIKTQKQYIRDHAKPTNKLTIEANSKLVDALIEASNGVLGYEMLGKQVTIVWKDSKDDTI